MNPLDHSVQVLKSFTIEPKPLDRLLSAYLRVHRSIGGRERRLISDTVFGVTRWKLRLEGWCKLAGIRRPEIRHLALCYIMWKGLDGCDALEAEAEGLGLPFSFDEELPRKFPGGEAAFYSFPPFIYDAVGSAKRALKLNEPSFPTVRVNTLKTDRNTLLAQISSDVERGTWDVGGRTWDGKSSDGGKCRATERSPYGIRFSRRINFDETALYRSGEFEVQDEASQLAVMLAQPVPGMMVLDACAGAGGKALMCAMLMENKGNIVVSEPDGGKLRELKKRAERAGASCVTACQTEELMSSPVREFDLVIVDAPCSGTGTLRRSPDIKWRLTKDDITRYSAIQKELLNQYFNFVKRGGRLVYLTCSLMPEENEEVTAEFVRRSKTAIVPAADIFAKQGIRPEGLTTDDGLFFKTDQQAGDWDGFFGAVFQK